MITLESLRKAIERDVLEIVETVSEDDGVLESVHGACQRVKEKVLLLDPINEKSI